jgi:hypothetical protein
MGLAERRAAKAFQDNHAPALLADITSIVGDAVEIEVRWDALATDDQAHLYDECWPQVYFTPLATALRAIVVDDMGKEALAGALKKIVITNESGIYYGDRWASFEGGVLTLDHEPCTNVGQEQDRVDGVVTLLEKNL